MATRRAGASLWIAAAALVWLFRSTVLALVERVAVAVVRWRLGPYKQRLNVIDTLKPLHVQEGTATKVAVIGGGLAGAAAATTLAERGLQVTLYEAGSVLGGKLSGWEHTFDDGETWPMEHGYHAFFGNYYNLDRFLARLGLDEDFARTPDYMILTRDGRNMSFAGLHRTPGVNLVHLAWQGFFSPKELVIDNPGVDRLNDLLNYHPVDSFDRLDGESYAQFADAAGLPERMRLIFRSFTRVFFAEASQLSMAELAKSFHGYFLSHEHGLLYRYPTGHHGEVLWKPIAAYLDALDVDLQIGKPVRRIRRQKNGRLRIGNRAFDHVVLATDAKAAKAILDESAEMVNAEAPGLRDQVDAVQPQNRYAVLRAWFDKDLRAGLPGFVSTDRITALDSITSVHRNQQGWRDFVSERGGSVLELHCYSVPDHLGTEAEVNEAMLADLRHFLPELTDATVQRSVSYVKDDFSAYFVGMGAQRPGVQTPMAGLSLAGDWVKLREPVMLMEAAFTSGLRAANEVLAAEGLREEPIYSVPEAGLLHGIR